MRSRSIPILAAFLTIIFSGTVAGQIRGSSMGGLTTIVSDGPFDSSRNPALITLNNKTTVGAVTRYRALDDHNFRIDASTDGFGIKDPDTHSAGIKASLTHKIGKIYLGFFIGEAGEDLYTFVETNFTLNNSLIERRDQTKQHQFYPVAVSSIAWEISPESSLGFQLKIGYVFLKSKTVLENTDDTGTIAIDKLTSKTTETSVPINVYAGYLYHTPDTQVGLLISPGTGTIYSSKTSLSYLDLNDSYDPLLSQQSGDQSMDISSHIDSKFIYANGIGFVVGGYKKVFSFLGLALEATMETGSSYEKDKFKLNENAFSDSYSIEKNTYVYNNKSTLSFRAGVELIFSNSISATLGGGYRYIRQNASTETSSSKEYQKTDLDVYSATSGFHYSINASTHLSLMLFVGYIESRSTQYADSFNLLLENKNTLLDIIVGAALVF